MARHLRALGWISGLSVWAVLVGFTFAQDGTPAKKATETKQGKTAEEELAEPGGYESIPAPIADEEEGVPEEEQPLPASPLQTPMGNNAPSEYVIQSGDTLWDICEKFLGNPWYWPKLWSLNRYIENPHLIYPGNILRFYGGSETAPPTLDIVGAGEEAAKPTAEVPPAVDSKEKPEAPMVEVVIEKPESVKLRNVVFVSKEKVKAVGKITHSGVPKVNLVFGDRVYLEFKGDQTVSVGNRYHVLERIKKVKHPEKFGKIGYLARRKAVVRIIGIYKDTIEGIIEDADDSVQRGDELISYQNPIREFVPFEGTKKLEGTIVDAEHQQYMISNNDIAFVDLGKNQGVKDGLKLYAVRRGDAVFAGDDQHLPYVIVGHLVVIDTFEDTSAVYVTSLSDSLAVGNKILSQVE